MAVVEYLKDKNQEHRQKTGRDMTVGEITEAVFSPEFRLKFGIPHATQAELEKLREAVLN